MAFQFCILELFGQSNKWISSNFATSPETSNIDSNQQRRIEQIHKSVFADYFSRVFFLLVSLAFVLFQDIIKIARGI